MKHALPVLATLACFVATAIPAQADQPSTYSQHVKPILAKYCLECHNATQAKGELVLETFKTLQEGGKSGPAIVPDKPDASLLVLLSEGKKKPVMPPRDAKQPRPEEVAALRAWVAAGAKEGGAAAVVTLPAIAPKVKSLPPVSALAYRPDGKVLAAGGHGEVTLLDPATGGVLGTLPGQTGRVTALTFSRDGRHLAVASGSAGVRGEVRLYPGADPRSARPDQILRAHADLIYDLSFSPDGKVLATGGYDRLIKLWDAATGRELRTLKDHSDTIYALAFSPDGKLLASAAADRAVKVWDTATGKRLFTLGESTDWVYALAWHPSGKQLAAAGVDRSIRVWKVDSSGGQILHSVFAHEGPLTRLAYAADGSTLYSLSEDRTAKAWDAVRLVERRVYPKQSEAVLALAVRPDHKQLALGRFDGTLLLLEEATGKVEQQPLPAKPKPPQVSKLTPNFGKRGVPVRITIEGSQLDDLRELVINVPETSRTLFPNGTSNRLEVEVTFPAHTPAGVYTLGLQGPRGETGTLPFFLDAFAAVPEAEPNDSPRTGQAVQLPAALVGTLPRAGDVDWYRFEARAGQQLGVQAITAVTGSKCEPILSLKDVKGRLLAESTTSLLGFTFAEAGTYALGIRDRDYRGGAEMHYRLQVGDLPVVTSVFPLGIQRGTDRKIELRGVNLPAATALARAEANASLTTRLGLVLPEAKVLPLGLPTVAVGEFPEVTRDVRKASPVEIPVPGTANGIVQEAEIWRFSVKKGHPLVLEVHARRLGSPLDSVIEVLDANGQLVPRATLRCQAKTYVTFRDHDSANPNLRIEAWSELAVNDYLWAGSELIRIKALPTHPDADCIFFSDRGQRLGYLDTTPAHQPMGQPLYKVSLHPPGTSFPPNGFPVITLPYRNDDGGPGIGKDSRLFFDPPADGTYQVRVSDARGPGSRDHAYRVTVRPPRPGFKVAFTPTSPAVWKGGAIPITVTAERLDGYDGPIALQLQNLPKGLHAPATTLAAGENTIAVALYADADAVLPAKPAPLRLLAQAAIAGREVTSESIGSPPKLAEPGDLVTTTEQTELTLKPGQISRMTVTIERRNGFAGRVPLEVRGLPHGVRVLDIGLNGILITEKETTRTLRLYAEPWVEATARPIVVLARREGKNTEHAARSVLLTITP